MPTYKLEPVESRMRDSDWSVSTLAPTAVVLCAGNENHARQRMHPATYSGAFASSDVLSAPWVNTALVRCTEDQSRDVPPDKALIANGKISINLKFTPFWVPQRACNA
jgi:hypothetical protein